MPTPLEQTLYKTLSYFAYFKYPLTAFELYKWQMAEGSAYSLQEILKCLEHSPWLTAQGVWSTDGFWGLESVRQQVDGRHERLLNALQKYRKLERVTSLLGRLPWVEGVAICNSLAFHHTTTKSDIDLFIVTKPGRVWSVRMLAVGVAKLLRARPHEAKEDPICLSFFVTTESLNLETVQLAGGDPYLAFWIVSLVPLVNRSGIFHRLYEENAWVRKLLPKAEPVKRAGRFRKKISWTLPWLPVAERQAARTQKLLFTKVVKELMNTSTEVVINDRMLKFHTNDRRQEIRAAHEKRLNNVQEL